MKASEVMTPDVVTVRPDAAVRDAARLMLDKGISGLPVLDEQGRLVGMVTEGDLMRRAELAAGRPAVWPAGSAEERASAYVKAHGMKVADVMSKEVVTLGEDQPLDVVARQFEERGIKRAPVVRDGKVVGIVSRANLLQGIVAAKAGAGPRDEAIRSAILTKARDEAGVRAPLVSATVSNGVVHLWGNVASPEERQALRVVAETTEGVREVHDHLRLMSPGVVAWQPE